MSAYYFRTDEEDSCYTLNHFKNEMNEEVIKQLELVKAEIEFGTDHFYCNEYGEVGLKGEGCGRECDLYSPRNGKNGRCKHSKNCYTHSDEKFILTKINEKRFKLTPK